MRVFSLPFFLRSARMAFAVGIDTSAAMLAELSELSGTKLLFFRGEIQDDSAEQSEHGESGDEQRKVPVWNDRRQGRRGPERIEMKALRLLCVAKPRKPAQAMLCLRDHQAHGNQKRDCE